MTVSIGIKGIEELLYQKESTEIRMSLAQAREIGIIFDERDIVELFSKGIAVDILIKKIGRDDILPARLQKQVSDIKRRKGDRGWIFDGLFDIKISDGKFTLTRQDVEKLLMEVIPGVRYKIGSMLEEYDGFCRIRIIDCEKDRFLSIREAGGLIAAMLPPGKYTLDVKSIKD